MFCVNRVGGLSLIILAAQIAAAADTKPEEEWAELTKQATAAFDEVGRNPGTTEAEQKEASHRLREQLAGLTRRALALAEAYPDAPEAPEALAWTVRISRTDADRDTAYRLLAERYLDREVLLPLIRTAWLDAQNTPHDAELLLRAAVDRSPNLNVRALACLSLGRHQQELASLARDSDHPTRKKFIEQNLPSDTVRRLRTLNPELLKHEAEALFERVVTEFSGIRPLGKDFPPLDEQARGALFQIRNLDLGCTVPEIEGEDIEGRPMKLSDYRGKVVVLSFWATWCGPCMGLVPAEKSLVERMRGRPFVLIGVNGDDDRDQAKAISAREGINWRSFWEGGRQQGTPVKWCIGGWPTVYLIDHKGVIRDDGVVYFNDDKAVDALVAEAEVAAKTP